MRILFVTQELDDDSDLLGITVSWLQALAGRLDRVYVLALAVRSVSLPANAAVYSMGKERSASKLLLLARFYRVLWSLALRRQMDLVFVHMVPHYAILAAPVARLLGVPVVLWYTRAAVTGRLRLAHALCQRVVSASPESFRLPSTKLIVTGHGIDTERFRPEPAAAESRRPAFDADAPGKAVGLPASIAEGDTKMVTRTILAVARISRVKDHETLLRAVALLNDRGLVRPVRLRIVGRPLYEDDHRYEQELRALAATLGIDSIAEFAGTIPNRLMPPEYRAANVVVNTSRTGSLDRVVLEAMACGRPVLTCNEAFAPVLGDYAKLLMFPPGDAAALADRLSHVLALGPDEVSCAARDLRGIVVGNHSVERWADQVVDIFRSLIGGSESATGRGRSTAHKRSLPQR